MTDDEARQLPVTVDGATLAAFGSSTWMTDAGPVDLLVELRDTDGGRHAYHDLVGPAVRYAVGDFVVFLASLDDSIGSLFHASSFGVNPASPWIFPDVATDAAGAAELVPFTYFRGFPENASLSAEANGLSTGFVNIIC